MPSQTFFKLPAEKQEKLLEAATREFSRKSFSEASINQIIKDAGIPRGSFYMYFVDKEDLFRYLMRGYMDQMLGIMEELLIRAQGDIFQALLDLFDYLQEKRQTRQLGSAGAMAAIVGRNAGIQKSAILEMLEPGDIMDRLGRLVNTDALELRKSGDLSDVLAILLVVSGPILYNGFQNGDASDTRAHFSNVLDILRRGMARRPAAVC